MVLSQHPDNIDIPVIGIPDYVLNALRSRNLSIQTIIDTASIDTVSFDYSVTSKNYLYHFIKTLKDIISKYDLIDTIVLNNLLYTNYGLKSCLFKETISILSFTERESSESRERLISLYYNTDYKVEPLFHGFSNEESSNKPFKLIEVNDVYFIIPDKGFTNHVLNSKSGFDKELLNYLFVKTLNKLTEQNAVKTNIFHNLINVAW